jgi:hypothetical protein
MVDATRPTNKAVRIHHRVAVGHHFKAFIFVESPCRPFCSRAEQSPYRVPLLARAAAGIASVLNTHQYLDRPGNNSRHYRNADQVPKTDLLVDALGADIAPVDDEDHSVVRREKPAQPPDERARDPSATVLSQDLDLCYVERITPCRVNKRYPG